MPKNKISLWQDIRQHKELYVMILPFFLLFVLTVLLPIIISTFLSLTYYNMLEPPALIGLQNYMRLFMHDDIFLTALKNTLLFSLITGPISYIMCFGIAWLVNECSNKVRVVLTLFFYAPALAGSSVFFIWQFLFSGDAHGFINGALMNLGVVNEPVQWLTDTRYNFIILMFVQVWMSLGTGFLAFVAGFKGIDISYYEAGSLDGIRNRMQELFYITLPMMKPQLLFGAVMQISVSFSVSSLSTQLFGSTSTNYSAHTIVLHMIDYGTVRYEMGYACAVAVILFFMMLLFKTLVEFILRYVSCE